MFSVVILFHHWFPLLEKIEIWAFILPRNFPAVFIIFWGLGRAGNPPHPTMRGGEGNPPSPRGRASIPNGDHLFIKPKSLLALWWGDVSDVCGDRGNHGDNDRGDEGKTVLHKVTLYDYHYLKENILKKVKVKFISNEK